MRDNDGVSTPPVAPVVACPTADELSLLVSGDLPGPRRAELETHLAGCVACRGLAAAVTSTELVPLSRTSFPPDSRFLLATVDADRFTLRRQIAHGGMGRIVEAWDNRHLRAVAIKMLLRPDAEMERRFTREARITAQLQHPTIVPLYEAGRWTSGEPFFAMKLVEGRSLGQVIGDATTLAERLALLPHLVDVTEALAYAHGRGVVHRDLKPGNILVGAFGETVVVDWGLAKELDDAALSSKRRRPRDEAHDDVALTSIGQAIGTPCYMPPEQARGDDVDARADVYALGALLYHLFAGEPPHASTTVRAAIEGVLAGPPAPLAQRVPDLPAALVWQLGSSSLEFRFHTWTTRRVCSCVTSVRPANWA